MASPITHATTIQAATRIAGGSGGEPQVQPEDGRPDPAQEDHDQVAGGERDPGGVAVPGAQRPEGGDQAGQEHRAVRVSEHHVVVVAATVITSVGIRA